MTTRTRIDLIADNGGGLTLQVHARRRYAHYYCGSDGTEVESLARDLRDIASGFDAAEWDGNEANEHWRPEYDNETERRGEYKWYTGTAAQVIASLSDLRSGCGHAEADLACALGTPVRD